MAYEGPGVDFGTLYYHSLLHGRGILYSNKQIMSGEETGMWVRAYASNMSLFQHDFAQAIMSSRISMWWCDGCGLRWWIVKPVCFLMLTNCWYNAWKGQSSHGLQTDEFSYVESWLPHQMQKVTAVYFNLTPPFMRGLNTCFEHKPNIFGPKKRKGAYLFLEQIMRGKNAPLSFYKLPFLFRLTSF